MLKKANLSFSVSAQSYTNDVDSIKFSTQDKNSAKLVFTIKEGKEPLNLTDIEGKVDLIMGDKSPFDDGVAIVTDPLKGILEYTITPEQIRHPGRARGELQLVHKDGSSVGGFRFTFTVNKALLDEYAGPIKEFYINDLEAVKEEARKKVDEIQAISDSIADVDVVRIDTRLGELEEQIGEGVGVDEQARQGIEGLTEQLAEKASLQDVEMAKGKVREVYNNGSSELDLRQYNYMTKFEIKNDKTVLSKIVIDVLSQRAGSMIEISLYDEQFNQVLSTDKQEVISVGKNEFAFPYKELKTGTYYFGITSFSTSEELIIRGDIKSGYIINKVYPSQASLSSVYEYSLSPYFELYSYDLTAPSGFEFQNNTQYRVFCKNSTTGEVYAWNTKTGRVCVSSNQGETFTDLFAIREAIWAMSLDETNKRLYYGTSNGDIYESSGLTSSDSFTKITPAGKDSNAVLLPQGLTIWKGYLWFGEYSKAPNELTGGCGVHKYNLSTKTWTLSKRFSGGRHVHNFAPQGTAALYVTIGDAGWGDQVGIHRITTINDTGGDTWTMWTGLNGKFTNHYPVDNVMTSLDGTTVLLGAGDRPKLHLTLTKISNTVGGGANISPRLHGFKDSGSGETVRNVVLDDEKNCYYVTAETNKPRICVSPYPWTQSYILQELSDYSVLTTPIVRAGEWIMFHTFRFHTVSFGAKKSVTINKRNYLYNNGEVSAFSSGTSGNQTSNVSKNSKSLFIESLCNQESTSQKTGFFTNDKVDLTKYKSVFVEGEFINCTGTNMIRIKVDTTTAIDGNVKEYMTGNGDNYVTQPFSHKLDIANINGQHHVHVQAIASGLNAKATIKVTRIFLSEV